MSSSLIWSRRNFLPSALPQVNDYFLKSILICCINLISISGNIDQTDEKFESVVVERRSTGEKALDLHIESHGN